MQCRRAQLRIPQIWDLWAGITSLQITNTGFMGWNNPSLPAELLGYRLNHPVRLQHSFLSVFILQNNKP